MSSDRLLIALLDVCSSDTMTAEYDVLTNRDSVRVKRNTIRDDRLSGERDVPIAQREVTCCYTENCLQNPPIFSPYFKI